MSVTDDATTALRRTDRLFIGGEWVAPSSDAVFDVVDSHSERACPRRRPRGGLSDRVAVLRSLLRGEDAVGPANGSAGSPPGRGDRPANPHGAATDLPGEPAAFDRDAGAGDERRRLGAEPEHGVADLLRLSEAPDGFEGDHGGAYLPRSLR